MRRSLAEPKSLRASAPIMRFVLSGAAAAIDRPRSARDAAGSRGMGQVAPRRVRVQCIAAAGRESGGFRASYTRADRASRLTQSIHASRGFMQTVDYGRIGRIHRDIGGGLPLVNWRFLLTFSSKSTAIGPLPRRADCATLRPLPPPAVALPRSRTKLLAFKDHLNDRPAIFLCPRAAARGVPSGLDDVRHALGGALGSAARR